MSREQRGWLRVERRKAGETWVLRYNVTRSSDGKRVEHTKAIGLLCHYPTESTAWAEVERQNLNINDPDLSGRLAFGDLCRHYLKHEVQNPARKQQKKAHTTAEDYNRIVTKRLIPRFGRKDALRIQPLEIESWLDSLQEREGLQNPTLDKYRRQMFLVYKHGQRHGLIPRTQEANPLNFVRQSSTSDYEAITITAEKTFEILQLMPQPERTLTLLIAATGLRISECLGLQWQDIDYGKQKTFVRRAWTRGKIGRPKSKASKAPVPLHPVLAAFLREWHARTVYRKADDWVFPSEKLGGRQPRVANMLVEDYLRPAAVKAAVPELRGDGKVRFGFHNLRHSLASFLVDSGTDPKTVQDMLRQADVQTTLKFYAHSKHETKLAAQAQVLQAILQKPASEAVN
jgi:integrase